MLWVWLVPPLLLRRAPSAVLLLLDLLAVGGLALFLVWLEFIIDRFLGTYRPMWSLIAAAVAVTLMLPLAVVRTRPNLRRQVRRRFHF